MNKQAKNMGIRKALIATNNFLAVFGESARVEDIGNGETIVATFVVMGKGIAAELFEIAKTFGLNSYITASLDGRHIEFKMYI